MFTMMIIISLTAAVLVSTCWTQERCGRPDQTSQQPGHSLLFSAGTVRIEKIVISTIAVLVSSKWLTGFICSSDLGKSFNANTFEA